MITDALTTFDPIGTSLTAAVAGTPLPSANTLDLGVGIDLGATDQRLVALFTTLPTSATNGATINAALQVSPDNTTWQTVEETGPQLLSSFTAQSEYLFRGVVPVCPITSRYMRIAYTVSNTLTAGAVFSGLVLNWSDAKNYPRNYSS